MDTPSYYGVSSRPQKLFGLKRKGRLRSYGITQEHVVVPVYSEQGFVEWLVEEPLDEVRRTLEQKGVEKLEKEF